MLLPLLLAGGVVAAGLGKKRRPGLLDAPDATQLEGSAENTSKQIAGLGNRMNHDVSVHAARPVVRPKNTRRRNHKGQATQLGRPTSPGAHKATVVKRGKKGGPTVGGVAKAAAKAGLGAYGVPPWGQDAIVNTGASALGTVKGWF